MISYPSSFLSREVMIAEARAHRKAGRLVSGEYWSDGNGCSIGCSIETVNRRMGGGMSHHDHAGLAAALGIPESLVQLQDAIYEGLPKDLRQDWPERFYTALPEGADLSGVWPLFAVWLLREVVLPVAGVNRHVVERVARGIETNWAHDDWKSTEVFALAASGVFAEPAARAAERAARSIGEAAERAAAWAAEQAAAWAAAEAARAAEGAAAEAARAAARAAQRAAAETARAAADAAACDAVEVTAKAAEAALIAGDAAAWAAAKLARDAAWTKMADKLCGLMAACGGTVA